MTKKRVQNDLLGDFNDSILAKQYSRGTVPSIQRWYDPSYITQREQVLQSLWNKKGIVRTYCSLPVDDALKGGIIVRSDNLNDDDKNTLEKEFNKHLQALKDAAYWARLFGGSALIALNDGKELEEPMPEKGKKEIDFMAIDRWRIGSRRGYDKVDIDRLIHSNNVNFFNGNDTTITNGHKIDNSRIQIMRGDNAPLLVRQALNGWGLSIVEKISANLDAYEQANELIFEMLKEGKVNVIKVKGLIDSLSAGNFDHIVKAIEKSNSLKKSINTMVMDSADEYMQTQATFTGIADIMKQLKMNISSDLNFPMTKLWGISASGFNSGEDDIENYNAMIESTVRPQIRPAAQWMLEVIADATLGIKAEGLDFDYKPLKELSAIDEEEIKKGKFDRYIRMLEMGLIDEGDLKKKLEKERMI